MGGSGDTRARRCRSADRRSGRDRDVRRRWSAPPRHRAADPGDGRSRRRGGDRGRVARLRRRIRRADPLRSDHPGQPLRRRLRLDRPHGLSRGGHRRHVEPVLPPLSPLRPARRRVPVPTPIDRRHRRLDPCLPHPGGLRHRRDGAVLGDGDHRRAAHRGRRLEPQPGAHDPAPAAARAGRGRARRPGSGPHGPAHGPRQLPPAVELTRGSGLPSAPPRRAVLADRARPRRVQGDQR